MPSDEGGNQVRRERRQVLTANRFVCPRVGKGSGFVPVT